MAEVFGLATEAPAQSLPSTNLIGENMEFIKDVLTWVIAFFVADLVILAVKRLREKLMTKKKDADYFNSEEFRRRCDARARESFEIISGPEAQKIHENYLKNQKASEKGK